MKRLFLIMLFLVFFFKIPMCFSNDVDGIWKTNGYNLIIEIKSNKYKVYEITEMSCLRVKPIYLKLPGFRVRSLSLNSMVVVTGTSNTLKRVSLNGFSSITSSSMFR